jgi:hypothetical protein
VIRLSKHPEPDILSANQAQWTAEFLAARSASTVTETIRYRYRHQDIKATLRAEAFEKCVYCETKIPVGETDHINPVFHCPGEICAWTNLALTCKECNTNKGSYYSPTEPLINPFADDPSAHLLVFGPLIMARAGDDKGLRTVNTLKLARRDLIERRVQRVERLRALIAEWRSKEPGATKDVLEVAIRDEAADSSEYAAVVRAYLAAELGWIVPATAATAAPEAATD